MLENISRNRNRQKIFNSGIEYMAIALAQAHDSIITINLSYYYKHRRFSIEVHNEIANHKFFYFHTLFDY